MSNTEENPAEKGREVVRTARTTVLRERMQAFVNEHGRSVDVEDLRQQVSGRSMSELVIEDREDRVE